VDRGVPGTAPELRGSSGDRRTINRAVPFIFTETLARTVGMGYIHPLSALVIINLMRKKDKKAGSIQLCLFCLFPLVIIDSKIIPPL